MGGGADRPTLSSVKLLDAVTATGARASHPSRGSHRTFQAVGNTTGGVGSATIKVQVSNDDVNFIDLATITLTLGTVETTDGLASEAAWRHVRGNVTALSGTGANVTLWMGA